MIKILHEHIWQKFPIVYTFYGRYDIDRTTEGPSLSYDYVILTPSPGVGEQACAFTEETSNHYFNKVEAVVSGVSAENKGNSSGCIHVQT